MITMQRAADMPIPADLDRAGVTARENEVFWLVGARLHNREIADQLVLSVRTVESHVTSLLRKLGVQDRAQLIAMAVALRSRSSGAATLPARLDTFIGRERELEVLRDEVERHRLVTLTGPPGAGKSRLAAELARNVATRPSAIFVDLTTATTGAQLPQTLLSALGIAAAGADATDVLYDALSTEPLWLLVDNCEHLADAVAALLHDVLRRFDSVRALATSQHPLDVPGEFVHVVGPLALPAANPESGAALLDVPATRLFVERAHARAPHFDVTAHPEAVAALCQRLDGLPLAIELAAARMRTFMPQELLVRLDEHMGSLGAAPRGARHATLETAIDWSYGLLGEFDQRLLQALSLFPGEFDYDGLTAALAGPDLEAAEIARSFPRLVDRSLVVSQPSATATSYRLLQSIRQFASQRLAETDPQGRRHRAWAEYFLRTAADAGPELLTASYSRRLTWFEQHWDDLREAMQWALEQRERDLAWHVLTGIGFGWEVVGTRAEVFAWLDELLGAGLPEEPAAAARAAQAAATLLYYSDVERAVALARKAVTLAEDLDGAARIDAQVVLGWSLVRSEEAAAAPAVFETALRSLTGPSPSWLRAYALQGLGLATADRSIALQHLDRAAAEFAAIGSGAKQSNVLYMMASLAIGAGEQLDEAREWLDQAARLAASAGILEQLHVAVQQARLAQRSREFDSAHHALTELLPAFRRAGDRRCALRCLLWLGEIEMEQSRFESAIEHLREAAELAGALSAGDEGRRARERLEEALQRQVAPRTAPANQQIAEYGGL